MALPYLAICPLDVISGSGFSLPINEGLRPYLAICPLDVVSGSGFSLPINEGLRKALCASAVPWKVWPIFLVDLQLLVSSLHLLLIHEPVFYNSSAL